MKRLSFEDFCELNDLIIYDSIVDFIERETDMEMVTEYELEKNNVDKYDYMNIFEDLYITKVDCDKASYMLTKHQWDIEAQYSDYIENYEAGLLD